jgi:glyoxylase-like metal-dependent hydrolase (beta-lactamase superfamily II)
MEDGARQLFRSLGRFRELPDYLQVWPGHGAGSACGKALGAVPQTTVGYEKMFGWAFQIEDEGEFVGAVLEGLPEPPAYFAQMKRINRAGPSPRPTAGARRLPPADFRQDDRRMRNSKRRQNSHMCHPFFCLCFLILLYQALVFLSSLYQSAANNA